MIFCPECNRLGKEGFVFCSDDGSRLLELDNTLLVPGTRVDVHRVGSGTITAASDDDYLDPEVLCYAIALDQELNGEIRHWFLKRTGVDVVTGWCLIEGQPLPTEVPPQKRYFAAHCEVAPIPKEVEREHLQPAHKDGGSADRGKECPVCRKRYEAAAWYCSKDGSMLIGVTLAGEPDYRTAVVEGEKLATSALDEGEAESFSRSLCPDCRSWQNWTVKGNYYMCNSCSAGFIYGEEESLRALGTVDNLGSFHPVGTRTVPPEEAISPFHDLLTLINKGGRHYWKKRFKTFEEGRFNFSWNWPSFFFGSLRYCQKGMWLKGILYRLGAGAIQAILIWTVGWSVLFMSWLGTAVFFGVMGANDYHLFCLKHRENLIGAKKQATIGMIIFWIMLLSPILVPTLLSVLGIRF
jgi:hypothetical protein